VCRWETWEESDEFAKLDPKTQDYNLQYDEIVRKESEKLFSAPNQRHYSKKIQVKDFDLNSPPKGIDRIVLAKHYLVPMMPEQFKFFHEQLKIFERKQREWRDILIARRELNEADQWISNLHELFEQTWKEFDVTNVTIEKFNKFFDEKSFKPRNLFPVKHRKMIEALENPNLIQQINADWKILRNQNELKKDNEDADIGELRPLKNAPVVLSELLLQIEMVEKSLQPFLWQVQQLETTMLPESEPKLKELQKKKTRLKSKTNFNRASVVSKSSQKTLRELRRSKSRLSTRSSIASSRVSSLKSIDESGATEETSMISKSAIVLIEHPRGKWSTRDIYEPTYNQKTKTVTFYTGSLGTFGFATRKYSNLPLKNWEIYPVNEPSERFVVMKIVTQNVTIEMKITNLGYTFRIINMKKVPFEAIQNPVKVNELKKVMAALNINIFPEIDASWYVEKISEKHMAMEFHTYKSMALYCLSHNFKSNVWNRWAHRRVALFESRMVDKNVFTRVMTTPLRTASVNVREKCTDLDVVELEYDLMPADQEVK
jgi:Cancer susceptibility candidate 1 C-terminal